jgi:pimeloyl-ACP methyl ester carboxylesterase
MGGVLAGLWAARRPEQVAGLALVATPFPAGAPPGSRHRGASGGHDLGLVERRAFQAVQLLWPALTFPVRSRTFPRAVVRDFLRHTPSSYWGSARHLLWDDAAAAELEGLRDLQAPVLLLAGEGDKRVPVADGERWAALLPKATARAVPGGHQLLLRSGFSVLGDWAAALPR